MAVSESRSGAKRATGRGILACCIGLVGITAGVAIGLPHLAKTGLTPASALGVAALVVGLVLMVGGARMILRGRRWWVAVPAILALMVATGLTLLTVGQGLAATNVPPTQLAAATPADRGLEFREVTTTTSDGVTLSAWYIPSANGAAVVLRHGAGSTRTDTLDHAAVLAGRGYGVLMMDARGHGLSDGRAMDFGWYGDTDITAGVDLLISQPDVDPGRIAAVGLSMGGEEAIGAAAADPRIRAVVAEGATNRMPADKQWLSDAYGVQGALQEQLDRVTYAIADLLTPADPPTPLRDAPQLAAPRPMLLIAGGAAPDEEQAADFIRAGSPDSVTVWVVPGSGHVAGLRTDPDQWRDRVTTFLDEALTG
ncbi:MAG: alpha/beta fold hydrolase [Candidatus Nanopelagicales bacterium]|jgi:fermentation-respiration switch protein FrsA (DUF1100 family)|nr:alpha/beta fold hydrolase [Candidatus Nanopelagicales bacterium]